IAKALVKPCTTAADDTPPCATAYDAVADVAIVFRNAMPSDAPTCCIVLTSADAAPASWFGTPSSAVDESGTKTCPMPRLIRSSAGTTWTAYDVDGESCVSHSIPSAADAKPADARTRGPYFGSVRDAI